MGREVKAGVHSLTLAATFGLEVGSEVGFGDEAVFAGGEGAEGEATELDAVEGEDGRAASGEHAADLVVFALGEDEIGVARVGGRKSEFGGFSGGVFAV